MTLTLCLLSALNAEHQSIVDSMHRNKQGKLQDSTDPLEDVICRLNAVAKETA